MPNFDWDKWNLGWALGLPKNEMWAKIRTGKTDKSGEPTFQYEGKPDVSSTDPQLADALAAHRFIVPGVDAGDVDHCFCGWSGSSHPDHLATQVENYLSPVEKPVKAPAKKAPAKRVAE